MSKREIVQLSIVVRDIEKSMEEYWKILGIGPWDIYTFSQETVRDFSLHGQPVKKPFEFMLAVATIGNMQCELIQPVEGSTPYESFLKEKGEGIHVNVKYFSHPFGKYISQCSGKQISHFSRS